MKCWCQVKWNRGSEILICVCIFFVVVEMSILHGEGNVINVAEVGVVVVMVIGC